MLEKNLITEKEHNELRDKANHSSDINEQKSSKGCISTYDLSEEDFKNLIKLNIELIKKELGR
ncbi:hypothetical protein OXH55_01925 [Clostridium ganghwense]|uniref:Uncharacterized protein n=1 Tax=Clostridium ganghwense TaxID=312089 RepID=A0ABT4CN32_9CLOT|nr:hypothetical protein [Clostridium ganghwense]